MENDLDLNGVRLWSKDWERTCLKTQPILYTSLETMKVKQPIRRLHPDPNELGIYIKDVEE